MSVVSDPARSFRELSARRDAPNWIRTLKKDDQPASWRRVRDEMPAPLTSLKKSRTFSSSRHGRFPQSDRVVDIAESILDGTRAIADVAPPENGDRLGLLVVLLDAVGRGDFPPGDEALRDLWWWLWTETEMLARPDAECESFVPRLWHAEALLASGSLFDGLTGMHRRRKQGRRMLWRQVDRETDSDGEPTAGVLDAIPAWIASILRGGLWCEAGDFPWGSDDERERCEGLFEVVAAMLRPDGSCSLSDNHEVASCLRTGLRLLGRKNSDPVLKMVGAIADGETSVGGKQKRRRTKSVIVQSEWARLLAARSGWTPTADCLAVRHDGACPTLEWRIGGEAFLLGDWQLEVSVDDQPVSLTEEWDVVSWFEDREVIYLELQSSESADLVLCRQFLLNREDQQVWLADAVSAPRRSGSKIDIVTRLPLAAGWEATQRRPSRELQLASARGGTVRFVPLSFPMEAMKQGPGVIRAGSGEVQIRQSGLGGLYCPVLFDWHAPRRNAPIDWRALTVTEDGRRLSTAEAVSARVRIGPQQWVIYRNINGSAASRAVIGYHHRQESVIGRFTRDGELDPLVMVELSDD